MDRNFETIFREIVNSEVSADSRREKLNQIQIETQKCEEEIKLLLNKQIAEEAVLEDMKLELCNRQSERLSKTIELNVLKEQKTKLENSIDQLKEDIVMQNKTLEDERQDFFNLVKEFCSDYGLHAEAQDRKKQKEKENLLHLKEEQLTLQEELKVLRKEVQNQNTSLATKNLLEAEVLSLQSNFIEIDTKLVEKRQEKMNACANLEQAKFAAQNDEEYASLQEELNALRSMDIENEIEVLTQQLNDAKRRQWQKTIQCQPKSHYRFKSVHSKFNKN